MQTPIKTKSEGCEPPRVSPSHQRQQQMVCITHQQLKGFEATVSFLRKQNKALQQQNKALQQQNEKLVFALIGGPVTADDFTTDTEQDSQKKSS